VAKILNQLRPVHVVGIGWHPYRNPSEESYVPMGLRAVREALADAGLAWDQVEASYVAQARLGMAPGRLMLRHLGALGAPITHVENASASGSTAFRQACMEVAAGLSDVVLAVGMDKPPVPYRAPTGLVNLAEDAIVPFTHFALLAEEYMGQHGASAEDLAYIALKNHRNGAHNPNAQRQKERTLDEILGGRPIAGSLTTLQCTPIGEGAAAVIVASGDAIRRLGLDGDRAVRVTGSATASEKWGSLGDHDAKLSEATVADALNQAGVTISGLDVIELHDAFSIEEILYMEAIGLTPVGHYAAAVREGVFDIGGQCAVSPSGGLLAMGHPVGPTGLGQIGEVTMQLRGEAGVRQQPRARKGLAHMVGLGAVCYAHVLEKA
jgi:acetyl-CoA acetyltransferase